MVKLVAKIVHAKGGEVEREIANFVIRFGLGSRGMIDANGEVWKIWAYLIHIMNNPDRWRQRLQNLNKAFGRLQAACAQVDYNELEVSGLVQTYEFTFELCWKTMRDKLVFEGYTANSPREAIQKAFQMELITDAVRWLEALESRNLFSHTYDEAISRQAIVLIKEKYAPMIGDCVDKLNVLAASA
jgi:nucleotidyltransferase substrate binding protein (TIGR01987 family)